MDSSSHGALWRPSGTRSGLLFADVQDRRLRAVVCRTGGDHQFLNRFVESHGLLVDLGCVHAGREKAACKAALACCCNDHYESLSGAGLAWLMVAATAHWSVYTASDSTRPTDGAALRGEACFAVWYMMVISSLALGKYGRGRRCAG